MQRGGNACRPFDHRSSSARHPSIGRGWNCFGLICPSHGSCRKTRAVAAGTRLFSPRSPTRCAVLATTLAAQVLCGAQIKNARLLGGGGTRSVLVDATIHPRIGRGAQAPRPCCAPRGRSTGRSAGSPTPVCGKGHPREPMAVGRQACDRLRKRRVAVSSCPDIDQP
jgi:hypothetical protein